MKITGLSVLVVVALAACGGGGGDATEEEAPVTEAMTQAVEKAEAVEDTAMKHKAALDEAIEEAEEDPQ